MKEKLLKSTFILLIGGFITKLLGMLIKITIAQKIGSEGLGMYMLILPTFMLWINLSQLGIPLALSKLIAEEKRNTKNLFFSIIPFLLGFNLLLMITIILTAPVISKHLLHNEKTYLSILAMAFVIPFTTISSISRSYFFGKGKMTPHVISNIVEDIVRLLIIRIGISKVLSYGTTYTTLFLILSNIISEITSTVVLLFSLPKNQTIHKEDLKVNKTYIKESLQIGIPNTASRMIASIGFFLEPIILTKGLLRDGYTLSIITREYGILSGYALPLLLLPSFFTQAISQAMLPILSKENAKKSYRSFQKHVKLSILLSIIISIPVILLLFFYPSFFLKLIYHTDEGISYIKFLAFFCLLEYLESPLSSILDALGKSKDNLLASIIGMSTRTITLLILIHFHIGFWSLLYSISINILFTVFYQIKKVRQYLTFLL